MNMTALHCRLTQFLLNLECLGPTGQRDAFINEVLETGGTYVPPPPDDPAHRDDSASHLFELSLHGIAAFGLDEAEAIRNWKKAARASVRLGDAARPPFPVPRNHAEEIANARRATSP